MALAHPNTPHPLILMCPPDHYGIEYEINPWMLRERPADYRLAREQWSDLRKLLEHCGANIALLPPAPGLPDLVFTANAGLIYHELAIVSHFRHAERQGEEPHFARYFKDLGFQVEQLRGEFPFEGAGDALFCGDTLYAGYRQRSHVRGLQQLAERLHCALLPLELVDGYFYHLDTCFCPLAPNMAAYYPPAFDAYAQQVLRDTIPNLITIESGEAHEFAANAVVVGKHVITNTGCPHFHHALHDAGFIPHATPLSEFVKAGGSAKCLTLRLDGEDAASWRSEAQACEIP